MICWNGKPGPAAAPSHRAPSFNWQLDVEIKGGPQISLKEVLTVDAYGTIDVTVPAKTTSGGAGKISVDVQPGGATKVHFLLMTSSVYDKKLTFTVDSSTEKRFLDTPLLLAKGAVALLGKIQKMTFVNDIKTPKAAAVRIVVGREATTST